MKRKLLASVSLYFAMAGMAPRSKAVDLVYLVRDTGEVALNGTTPSHGDDVTTGGWSYAHAPLGSHYGVYHGDAAYEGALGIRLQGHGTFIYSPPFSAPWGTASVNTRIVDATGGVPNDLAISNLRLFSNEHYVSIDRAAGDYNFYWVIDNESGYHTGVIPGVTAENTNWWTYTIEVTPEKDACFTVFDGANTSSVSLAHGIDENFSRYAVVVNRLSSGYEVATADYDNLFFIGIPEPATLSLLALGGLAVIRRRRRT